ncbi:MAG: SRPBCC family protein [Phycisphaerae bacterium]|nr:SRPBCC family protein [Phycisphaerae bacterium]
MSSNTNYAVDSTRDLVLERVVDVPPDLVWMAWTTPEHLVKWFTPKPWSTVECELDLRPGGIFRTIMRSPEGEIFPDSGGCVLEVVQGRKLVFTDALGPGYRPRGSGFMTATILIEAHGNGTKYTATVLHSSPEDRQKHVDMGFFDGWSKALDQLVELVKSIQGSRR